MSKFAEFLVARLKAREHSYTHGLPIRAVEGQYYSTLTGSDPPTIEIDWEQLQSDIEALEAEFKATK